ncbi:MAG: TaqI-like C-terminal specificity domain-containing protein, partial [Salibacteraceae bacterium]
EYAKGRRKRKKDTIKALDTQLQAYRQWLLELTICDPACGSGAFLNQALEFLMHEHAYIDELESQLLGHDFQFPGVENHILEKNLFGVDINEESVEIAKLSLWLRTAQKGRKLTTLSNNIKCGNSLIDDPEVAGDKAFDWQQAFPQVFKSGARSARSGQGFDAVIGNPPYVSSKGENFDDKTKEFLTHQYNTAAYQIDLYMLFMERGLSIQKLDGLTSFIVPNSWLNNLFLAPVRKYLLTNSSIYEIVTMASGIFESANVDTVIVTYTKKSVLGAVRLIQCVNSEFIFSGEADKNQWLNSKGSVMNVHLDKDSTRILDKLEVNSVTLSSITEIARGVGVYHKRVGHTKELIAEDPYQSANKKDETFVPYLRGKNLSPYLLNWNDNSFISYGKWLAEPRESKYFNGPRIVLRQIPAKRLVATYLDGEFITDQSVFIAKFNSQSQFNPKAVLCILNSELMSYYFRLKYSEFDDLFPKVKLQHFKDFPIVKSTPEKTSLLGKLGESRLSITKENSKIVMSLISLLQSKFNLEKPTTKLQNWHELDFKTFLAELKKAKVALSLSEEAEWMAYFNEQKQKAQSLKAEIDKTDGEIDRLVYELYDLTEEEIRIVEQADKYE